MTPSSIFRWSTRLRPFGLGGSNSKITGSIRSHRSSGISHIVGRVSLFPIFHHHTTFPYLNRTPYLFSLSHQSHFEIVSKTSRIVYRRLEAGESLIEGLESLALSEGIREAAVISCIGSLSQLKRRNLCNREREHERETINEILELVSAEGYVQPLEEGGIRVHIHVAAARPSGEIIGGHCEDATCFTGAYIYLQVIEDTRS